MTRFAKVGQNRKRPHDATSWNDLKRSSKQHTGNKGNEESCSAGTNASAACVLPETENGGSTTTFIHPGKEVKSVNKKLYTQEKGEKRQKFDKRNKFRKGGKRQMDFECYNCKAKGHKASECPEPSDGKNDNIVCHACKGLGHKAFRCPNSPGLESKGADKPLKSENKWRGRPLGSELKSKIISGKFNKQNRLTKDAWSKEKRSEWRRQKREKDRESKKHCFNCRSAGHQLSECPELQKDVEQGTGICFKCGSTEHKIHQCHLKLPKDKFPFAKCFICNETGHLSKQCPDNPRGLYPDGGCCKQCGSVEHLKRDCPEYHSKQGIGDVTLARLDMHTGGDVENVPTKKLKITHKEAGPKTVKF